MAEGQPFGHCKLDWAGAATIASAWAYEQPDTPGPDAGALDFTNIARVPAGSTRARAKQRAISHRDIDVGASGQTDSKRTKPRYSVIKSGR